MPRMARVFIDNACQHITARSHRETGVFQDEEDFVSYLKLIHRYKLEHGCLIYAYCIMDNHVHLILESPCGLKAMSAFMHKVSQSYAMKFNHKYNTIGHLWQNRYKNYIILKNEYLINAISYIEYNPVRAEIVSRPEDYPWSSYRARILGEKNIILDRLEI